MAYVPLAGGGELHIDYRALGSVMRGPEVQGVVLEYAHQIASAVAGDYAYVYVDKYTTDRAATQVAVLDFAGDAYDRELLYAPLITAARASGLDVVTR